MCAMGEPSGPIEKGTTYMVRPFMLPEYSERISSLSSAGARQWLVGPASISCSHAMNVRSSTRATSSGSDSAR